MVQVAWSFVTAALAHAQAAPGARPETDTMAILSDYAIAGCGGDCAPLEAGAGRHEPPAAAAVFDRMVIPLGGRLTGVDGVGSVAMGEPVWIAVQPGILRSDPFDVQPEGRGYGYPFHAGMEGYSTLAVVASGPAPSSNGSDQGASSLAGIAGPVALIMLVLVAKATGRRGG